MYQSLPILSVLTLCFTVMLTLWMLRQRIERENDVQRERFFFRNVPVNKTDTRCLRWRMHGSWSVEPRRRLFYGSIFEHEFSLLEAVLTEIAEVVDGVIIGEGNQTFTGKMKPLYLHLAVDKEPFSRWKSQLRVIQTPVVDTSGLNAWGNENGQKIRTTEHQNDRRSERQNDRTLENNER